MNKVTRERQTGLAMVIVIWVLSLMTIMAGSFALTMRRETIVISAVKDNAEALAVAETGLAIAQQMLSLIDAEKRWKADGSIYKLFYKEAEIRVRLFSEQGKIDINQADEKLLSLMMSSTTLELDEQQSLVSAILDWRDEDELVHLNGAEKNEYDEAGLSYQPANKDFNVIDELRMVLGVNQSIYEQLQPLVTVYSERADVDLKIAAIEVQYALANPDNLSWEDYLKQRLDNLAFQFNDERLSTSGNADENQQANGDNNVYTIISQARLIKDVEASIKVTMRKAANDNGQPPYQVLEYRQLYQGFSLFSDEMEQFLVIEDDESRFEY